MKAILNLAALLLSISSLAQTAGTSAAPAGDEWQSPENLSLNKEQPRAYMFSFSNMDEAKKVLPYGTSYYQSLDGTWKFHWVAKPEDRPTDFYQPSYDVSAWDDITVPGCWNVQGLQKDGTMKYGVPIYVNQPVIFYHEIKVDDWKEGVMRQPKDERWTTYKYPNEVGSYRRTFTTPKGWNGRRIYINFDGVDSFFYLWINGHYVGFSKNSRNTASFDITPYLNKKGENTLAVEVYRSSDGSFLESQDMFRLPGIFRSTYLTSMPELQLRDLAVRTESLNGTDAVITLDAEVRNLSGKGDAHSLDYFIYQIGLYEDNVEQLLGKFGNKADHDKISLVGIRPWSAEAPHRYAVVAVLKDAKGKVSDIQSTYFGVRKVEIRQTPAEEDEFGLAGRYFYVNGKPVKLKGVNRHETNPTTGHAISHEQMQEEVFLMKRGNINHIRMSHYSNDPYMYYLCDKYGIYLEDECNLESHQYYYGKESLSHPQEWKAAHINRNLAMVHSHVNHPSIVIWSLGNEAGPGDNFKAAYEAIKAYDPSRPVQYERNNNIVDMGSNQYPSVAWVQQVAKGNSNVKYPYHISEYAHSMGNSLGNLVDYWNAMESTNFFCGGAIWDWVDQAIDTYTKDGTRYMGYGGDHGDWPNDGMFCMNGIMLPDLTPKPQYFEVKKVYQNVDVKLDSIFTMAGRKMVKITVFNKNYFTSLDQYNVVGTLLLNGKPIKEFPLEIPESLAPRKSFTFIVPMKLENVNGELFLNVEFRQKNDTPWARAGYVQMAEQLPLTTEVVEKKQMETVADECASPHLSITEGKEQTSVRGDGFLVTFDNTNGSIYSMSMADDNNYLIEPGNGPKLDAFRAPVDNDNWAWGGWFKNGLYDLHHRALSAPTIVENKDYSITIVYTVLSKANGKGGMKQRPGKAGQPFEEVTAPSDGSDVISFTTTQRYTVFPDGSISVAASIVSSDATLVLPRLGYAMKLDKSFNKFSYYGRGPLNNYADRKTGSFVGIYNSTVQEQFVNFPKPQSMGNREDVRWCALQNKKEQLLFVADNCLMSVSALPWSAQQMTLAAHPHELPQSDGTYLHLDCQVTGLGGNSCGQGGPLQQDRVTGSLHQMKFIIRPTNLRSFTERALVETNISCPVSISRDRAGNVSIQGDGKVMDPTPICYQITEPGKKAGNVETYYSPESKPCIIPLRKGGKVVAWYKGDDKVKTSAEFEAIETVPMDIAYVSSEEGPAGEVAKNLVDGDPSTIWHTMYSITVPKYPHWIDFDCNETINIKGFNYLPRQDGSVNGNIKGYKVEVSMDGKTWSQPVAQGEFTNDSKEKKVMFQKPQKARFVRFTALSSHNGADYASGAEFSVIGE